MKFPKWIIIVSLILFSISSISQLITSLNYMRSLNEDIYFNLGFIAGTLFLFFFIALIPLELIIEKIKEFKKT